MDSLPVHIAVLTIGSDSATADRATAHAIGESARAAGHLIIDEETAKDNEGAIRDQLVRWIAQQDIDVVIVAASVESEAASAALAPLVMQTLPGFTDLFRWLTFQEIGAAAMLSAAEAAQCESTFVFVLPAHEAAVRAAMDKLILPQLDVRTKPKNLVGQMPRLRDAAKQLAQAEASGPLTTPAAAHHAIPVPIAAEKTSGGSGLPPKLPARNKPRTANIISRRADDPPTKPIDLARLEKQIELSNANEAQTKQIELAKHEAKTKVVDMSAHQAKTRVVGSGRVLPRTPPGADASAADDDDDSLTFTAPPGLATRIPSLTGTPARTGTPPAAVPVAHSSPGTARHTAPVSPTARVMPGANPIGHSTPGAARSPTTPPAGTVPTPASASPTVASTPAADRHTAVTPPAASPVAHSTPASDRHSAVTPVAAVPVAHSTPGTGHSVPTPATRATPPAAIPTVYPRSARPRPPTAPPGSVRSRPPTAPPSTARTRPPTEPPPAPIAARRLPTEPPPTPIATRRPATEPPPTPIAARRPPTEPPPARDAKQPSPNAAELWSRAIASHPEDGEVAGSAGAAPVATGDAGGHVESAADAGPPPPITALLDGAAVRKPKPTPPPPAHLDPFAAATTRPIGGDELPQGDFVYPIKRSGTALLLKLLVGLAVAGLGFFAFVKLYPGGDRPPQTASVAPPESGEPAVTAQGDPGAAAPDEAAHAAGSADAEDDPEIDSQIEIDAPADPTPASTPRPRPRPAHRPATSHAVTQPPTDPAPSGRDGSGPAAAEPADTTGSAAAQADPGCDEVSCVLSKYDRPCCERFRPADTFTPKNVVPDVLDRSMVKAGVEKVKPRIVACGEKLHGKGTVKVAMIVTAAGGVKSARVTEAPEPALGKCVADAMHDATFGKTKNGGEFVYPFVF